MQIFYSTEITDNACSLGLDDSKHCVNVLRFKQGDLINVFDGKGGVYTVEITDLNTKRCSGIVVSKYQQNPLPYYLHVIIAPTKNIDRYEWFVEKAVEIGISEITPVISKRSDRKVIKNERIEKIAISAMKQSKNAYLPIINDAVTINELLNKELIGEKYIAYCFDGTKVLFGQNIEKEHINIMIGPEGDFTEDEVDLALKKGFTPVSLGSSRLRTETAGIFACAVVQNQFNLKT